MFEKWTEGECSVQGAMKKEFNREEDEFNQFMAKMIKRVLVN